MTNPAINVAIVAAAQQQAQTEKAILDPLRGAAATSPARAVTLNLSGKGSERALKSLMKRGYVRKVGNDRYWIDEGRIAEAKQSALRWTLITVAFLTAMLVSLAAILATR